MNVNSARYVWISCVALVLSISYWASLTRPWVKEVWISTTRDSISSPDYGTPLIVKLDNNYYVNIQVTPAPFPPEASDMYNAAKYGKIVHVHMRDGDEIIEFDISNFKNYHMQVRFKTEVEAKEFVKKLYLN